MLHHCGFENILLHWNHYFSAPYNWRGYNAKVVSCRKLKTQLPWPQHTVVSLLICCKPLKFLLKNVHDGFSWREPVASSARLAFGGIMKWAKDHWHTDAAHTQWPISLSYPAAARGVVCLAQRSWEEEEGAALGVVEWAGVRSPGAPHHTMWLNTAQLCISRIFHFLVSNHENKSADVGKILKCLHIVFCFHRQKKGGRAVQGTL